MDTLPSTFRVHTYAGRENGMMVIGPASALRALANHINAGVDGAAEVELGKWPREVASFELLEHPNSLYPFKVSFHVDTVAHTPATNVFRSSRPFWLFVLLAVFAAVGAFAILRWAATGAF